MIKTNRKNEYFVNHKQEKRDLSLNNNDRDSNQQSQRQILNLNKKNLHYTYILNEIIVYINLINIQCIA